MKESFEEANEQAWEELRSEIDKSQKDFAETKEKGTENVLAIIDGHLAKQVKKARARAKAEITDIAVKDGKDKAKKDATDAMKGVILFWQELFEQQKSRHEALQHEHNALQHEHDALQDRHNALQDRHDALQDTHNALQDTYNALQDTHSTLQDRYTQEQNEHEALRGKCKELEEEVEKEKNKSFTTQGIEAGKNSFLGPVGAVVGGALGVAADLTASIVSSD